MGKVILSIDCGTQSLRAILFSLKGELIDIHKINYVPYISRRPGYAEQDPEIYWGSLKEACLVLKEKNPENFGRIIGVGVTSLRDSMVNVDRKGKALRPLIVWLDQRKAKQVYFPSRIMRFFLKVVRMEEVLHKMQKEGKCNWIKQNQPGIWNNTYKYLQTSGYLNFHLTGQFAESVASQIGHIPFDYKRQRYSRSWSSFNFGHRIFPIEQEKLPDLVLPGKIIGGITEQAHTLTGIPVGVPVIACGSDKGCETIGMGVVDTSMGSLSFGTTATIQTTTKKYMEPMRFMPSYPAVVPGHYNPEIEIFRGYWMITWFKDEFAHKEVEEAEKKGIPTEEALNRLLRHSPPGAMGLVVQPYWSPGLKEPSAKGAIIGFGDVHKKAHVYRAVIEGLSFGLLDGMHKIEKRGGFKFHKLAVSGGASQSDEICQISADVFNLPIVRGKTWETSGLGAAIITAVGTGEYPSVEMAVENMVHYDKVFEPNQDHVLTYSHLYHRVYKKMYKALAPLYKEVREITGYPE